jgi:hypothetical protein
MLHLRASICQVPCRETGAAKLPGITRAIKLGSNSWAQGKIAYSALQNKGQTIRRNASGRQRSIKLDIFWCPIFDNAILGASKNILAAPASQI